MDRASGVERVDEPPAGSLPHPLTPLIGRDAELLTIRELLTRHRLVTLVGTGGCGKTRLAVEVVRGTAAVFVDLAAVGDPARVLPTVARALGLREAGGRAVVATLYRHLAARSTLLLLDNLEHVLDAVPDVADLLARCPDVRVLATSRSPLHVPGEQLVPVRALPVPDPAAADPHAYAGVELFVARVRASQPAFELGPGNAATVVQICRVLGGLPLALELAAAQVRPLGLDEVLARVADPFVPLPVRPGGVPPRHQTLADAVSWSVALLDEPAATLFGRLSVFVGGWTAPAAAQVCGAPGDDVLPALASLVEHSLVDVVHAGTGVRYRMAEPLREYAARLVRGTGEEAVLAERHAHWCGSVAAQVGRVAPGSDEVGLLQLVESELGNIRAALERCPPERTTQGLGTAADLYFFWDIRGHLGEGCEHLCRLLGRPEAAADPASHQAALQTFGLLMLWQDDHGAAREALTAASELAEARGDAGGWAWCAGNLAISHFMAGDVDDAAVPAERGLRVARAVGEPMPLLRTTCGLGLIRWAQGRRADAVALLEENARIVAPSLWGGAKAAFFLGWFGFVDGDLDAAEHRFRSAAEAFERVGDCRSLPDCRDGLACVAVARGDAATALELFASAAALRERAGARRHTYLRSHCERAEARARELVTRRPGPHVTDREHEVARLVADGCTNRQIGRRLGISERTAERHVENLRTKLGVQTRAQVAAWVAGLPSPR